MNPLSTLTITRLLAVRAAILAEPALYDQGDPWVPQCGTPGCILGWVVKLFCPHALATTSVRPRAREALELDWDQTDRLFSASLNGSACDVLSALYDRYAHAAPGSPTRAQCAAERIDHFIATGGEQ